jgi:hypothetical protein
LDAPKSNKNFGTDLHAGYPAVALALAIKTMAGFSLGRPREGFAGEPTLSARQVIYERAQAEASKGERKHGHKKDALHHVRSCEKPEMKEQCAPERERARHRLSSPTGCWGRRNVKGPGSAAKDPVINGVEGIEFREQSAPPQDSREGVKQRWRLKPDSCQEPQKHGARLELQR